MKRQSILTTQQTFFLDVFGQERKLSRFFYLTGGTALTEYYIPYRYSEDLDFFSESDVEIKPLISFLTHIKKGLDFSAFEYNTSFNRNLFFLSFPNNNRLKLEFTYFPFPRIEKKLKTESGIEVDSVLDIAVNKLFTIYQKPRSRDFIDLYMICRTYGYSIDDLVKKAKVKFDWHVDSLKLGSQFLLSEELKDYPRLIEPMKEKDWQTFWKQESLKLKSKIIV